MLPGIDGHEVCRRIQRERPVPVLMLTALDAETDLLVGLGVGADDYMTKPFSQRELVARVRALLRRSQRAAEPQSKPLTAGPITIDAERREVTRDGQAVHLTPTEFDLVHKLALRPGIVFSREQLLEDVWGYEDGSAGTRTVDSHVAAVRRKLGADVLRTVQGIGYAFATPSNRHEAAAPTFPSLKLKLGIVIVIAVWITAVVTLVAVRQFELPSIVGAGAGVVLALGVVQLLARGTTKPLREMASVASAMARGEHGRQVAVTSRDEVGELARAFNRMTAELAETDRLRRDLVANVSHELRTPLGALQAVLENVIDGVSEPDPETLRTMLAQTRRLGRLVSQLLDLSRLEAGDQPFDIRPFAVRRRARGRRPRGAPARARGRRVLDRRPRRAAGRRRPGAHPPGRHEPRRERRALLAAPRRDRAAGVVDRRPHGHGRGRRRRAGHPGGRPRARLRALLPRATGAAAPTAAAPGSASRSRAGSSSCTAARSAPSAASRAAATWSSRCPRRGHDRRTGPRSPPRALLRGRGPGVTAARALRVRGARRGRPRGAAAAARAGRPRLRPRRARARRRGRRPASRVPGRPQTQDATARIGRRGSNRRCSAASRWRSPPRPRFATPAGSSAASSPARSCSARSRCGRHPAGARRRPPRSPRCAWRRACGGSRRRRRARCRAARTPAARSPSAAGC